MESLHSQQLDSVTFALRVSLKNSWSLLSWCSVYLFSHILWVTSLKFLWDTSLSRTLVIVKSFQSGSLFLPSSTRLIHFQRIWLLRSKTSFNTIGTTIHYLLLSPNLTLDLSVSFQILLCSRFTSITYSETSCISTTNFWKCNLKVELWEWTTLSIECSWWTWWGASSQESTMRAVTESSKTSSWRSTRFYLWVKDPSSLDTDFLTIRSMPNASRTQSLLETSHASITRFQSSSTSLTSKWSVLPLRRTNSYRSLMMAWVKSWSPRS